MLAVEEFAVKKGHKYVTTFYDLKGHRIIYIAEGKGAEPFDDFVQAMQGRLDLAKVQVVGMDMSHAFISASRRFFPGTTIVFDHFHIFKLVNDVVKRIRIKEARKSDHLAKTKYCWLKNPENPTSKLEERMNGIKDLAPPSGQGVPAEMDRLGKEEPPSKMVDLAETMACHSDGIIASISRIVIRIRRRIEHQGASGVPPRLRVQCVRVSRHDDLHDRGGLVLCTQS